MYDYRTTLREREVANELAAYQMLLTTFHNLGLAASEGVFEITVRSHTQVITVQVPIHKGGTIASQLSDFVETRVGTAETRLNTAIENDGDDCHHARVSRELSEAQHENAIKQVQAEYVATQQLAQQAAAPTPRPVGRPRKSTARPAPAVAAELSLQAASVPMNGTGQQPTGRASSTPQA